MTEEIPGRNWDITYVGALSVLLMAAGFIAYLASSLPVRRPLLMAAGAGLFFAIAAKAGDMDRMRAVMKPLSGFFNMVAGLLLIVSVLLFTVSSLEIIQAALAGVEDRSLLALVRAVVLPVAGYSTVLFGVFVAASGASLTVWDSVGERLPVGTGRGDFMFTGILAGLTVFGVFGTAFLRDLPLVESVRGVVGVVTGPSSFSAVIAAVMVLVSYITVRMAWKALPIREAVPRSSRETYDRLARAEVVVRWLAVPVTALGLIAYRFAGVSALEPLAVLGSPGVRTALFAVAVLSLVMFLGVKLLRLVTGGRETLMGIVPYLLFGGIAYIGARLSTGYIEGLLVGLPGEVFGIVQPVLLAVGPTQFVMVVMTVGSASAVWIGISAGMFRRLGLIPRGVEGVTLVAAGVFFSAVGFYLYAPRPTVLFTGVALSMVVWEMGKRSVILGAEVGRAGSTYQAEIIQVAFKLVIAFVAVVLARTVLVAAENMVFTLPSGSTGFTVFLLAVLGIGLVTAGLKDIL